MTSITLLLFLMVLGLFFFFALSKGGELSETQRQARRKMIIYTVVCAAVAFSLLAIIPILPIGPAKKMFLITILPIPYVVALQWIYRHGYNGDHGYGTKFKITFIITGILCSFIVLLAFRNYNIQINMPRNLPERLPPAVPPPVDFSLPPPLISRTVNATYS